MKKTWIVLLSVVALLCIYILYSLILKKDPEPLGQVQFLPTDPERATYLHQGGEITFAENHSAFSEAEVHTVEEMLRGDMNGDGLEDAVIVFNTEGKERYVALALQETDGYLGMNSVPLEVGEATFDAKIDNEIFFVDSQENNATTTKYFTLVGSRLMERTVTEPVKYGHLNVNREVAYLEDCENSENYTVATSSPSYAVLEAVYKKKRYQSTSEDRVFVIVTGVLESGIRQNTGATASSVLSVTGVLQAPKNGSCTNRAEGK